ncbi:MAG: long-chain fatty acid--CoA ligase [Candidatus Aureabacteria bacterium]|nr:long-chain fatty acid--CoA ligase [Candidatus Auribacterota bacterium]
MRASHSLADVQRSESLGAMLEARARRHPRRIALFLDDHRLSYGLLNARANTFARALRERLHVTHGDRVGILLQNCPECIVALFGILKAGAAAVPLNTYLTAPEIRYILADAEAKVLISSDEFAPTVRKFSEDLPSLTALITIGREDLGCDTWLLNELLKGIDAAAPEFPMTGDNLAVIIYTSGTTGKPKGAMLTHTNLLSNLIASGTSIRIRGCDRFMLLLPMFHSFTITTCIMMPLAAGAGIVVIGKLRSMEHIVRRMLLTRVTVFIGIPHIYDVLSQRGMPFWLRMLLRVRVCISGSAPLSEQTLKRFEQRIRIPLLEGYGLSETSPVVSINPLDGIRKPGSVGRPIPGVEVRIVSGEGEELPLGRIGEIAVRGPNVMKGYLNRPRETKETVRDGWLLTGDIGRIDEDGYIYILDRKKDMILFHGMNVYPREVEEVLYGHPAVAEAAVVGAPDRHRGELPVAVISLKEGCRAEASEITEYCKGSLAPYKIPHRIVFVDRLPRTATGKILKRELKKYVGDLTTDFKSATL